MMLTLAPWCVSAQPSVVLELFTSQSCEECPKADALVEQLDKKNPSILVLSCPIDYWNYSGWEDTLSRSFCTKRQLAYSVAIEPYRNLSTPELIMNGRVSIKGIDAYQLSNVLSKNRTQLMPVQLDHEEDDQVRVRIPTMKIGKHGAQIHLLLYGVSQKIRIGNGVLRGQKVTYTHPVQSIDLLHKAWKGEPIDVMLNLGVERMEQARGVVVLVQEGQRAAGKILAMGHKKL